MGTTVLWSPTTSTIHISEANFGVWVLESKMTKKEKEGMKNSKKPWEALKKNSQQWEVIRHKLSRKKEKIATLRGWRLHTNKMETETKMNKRRQTSHWMTLMQRSLVYSDSNRSKRKMCLYEAFQSLSLVPVSMFSQNQVLLTYESILKSPAA